MPFRDDTNTCWISKTWPDVPFLMSDLCSAPQITPETNHYYLTHCFPCINGFNVRDGWDGFNVRDGWLECDKCINICFTVQTHVDNVVIPYTGEKESNSVLQLNWSTLALLTNGISEIGWRLMPSTCTVKYVLILLGFMTKVRFCWPVLSIVPPIYYKYLVHGRKLIIHWPRAKFLPLIKRSVNQPPEVIIHCWTEHSKTLFFSLFLPPKRPCTKMFYALVALKILFINSPSARW